MDLSIFLFRLFGFYSVIVGLAYIFKREYFRSAIEDYFKSPGLILVSGVITLIMGLLVVLNYNVWELSPKVVVTLFGWIMVVKGLLRLFIPYWGEELSNKLLSGSGAYITGVISILIGAWLLWAGYAN